MTAQPTCKDRITEEYQERMNTIRELWEAWNTGENDGYTKDGECLNEFGLAFDYVAPQTFKDQEIGYFRYQLSWGGPSDEFRIFANQTGRPGDWKIYKIEYWFLDWFDGAHKLLAGKDFKFMDDMLTGFFMEAGSFDSEYQKAMEDWQPEEEDDISEADTTSIVEDEDGEND